MQINIGFGGLLGIIFIILKLTDQIDWSWWLVLLPIYGGLIFFIIAVLLFVVFGGGRIFVRRK